MPNLLADAELSRKFVSAESGALEAQIAVCRLAPQDYHRSHFAVDCEVGASSTVDGAYYTVNPMAVRADVDVFTENKRTVTELRSRDFGTVAMVCVGATMVRGPISGEFSAHADGARRALDRIGA